MGSSNDRRTCKTDGMVNVELLSIDLSNYCSKQCSFRYNHSTKEGNVLWLPSEVIRFAIDCTNHGVKAISLGGGEPFEYDGIWEIIDAVYPHAYLSITTNGLPLHIDDTSIWDKLSKHRPDKIHISIHHPNHNDEIDRVMKQLVKISECGIKAGCNLLVSSKHIEPAHSAYKKLATIMSPEQIILIPQRFQDTPTPKDLSYVAGDKPFQSPSCILKCEKPDSFASVSWDKKVNFCSYAQGKQSLSTLDYKGLINALNKVHFKSCMK